MLATLLALGLLAQHGQPYDLGEDLRWARAGGPQDGHVTYLGDATEPLQCDGDAVAGAAQRPCCYPWRSQIVVAADKPVTLCFSMTSTMTLGAYASEQATVITDDDGLDGNGACVDIGAVGQTVDMIPLYHVVARKPGSRSPITLSPCTTANGCTPGICTGAATDTPSPDAVVYPACSVDGDCTDVGSGTCDTTLSANDRQEMLEHGCAYIVGRASAATTRVSARVER